MARNSKINAKKKIENVMAKYGITFQEYCLGVLVNSGIPDGDAFAAVFPEYGRFPSQREAMYIKLVSEHPGILAFIKSLSPSSKNTQEILVANNFDLSTKEGLLASLEQEYAAATEAKQRADILMKIADLRKMKQDEETDKNKLIHYYLPLRCDVCPAKGAYEGSGSK